MDSHGTVTLAQTHYSWREIANGVMVWALEVQIQVKKGSSVVYATKGDYLPLKECVDINQHKPDSAKTGIEYSTEI